MSSFSDYLSFPDITLSDYNQFKLSIQKSFQITPNIPYTGIRDSFHFNIFEEKYTVTYYNNNKLIIQYKKNANYINEINKLIKKPAVMRQDIQIPYEESTLKYDYYIGCDESGKGESFGSMYLGCSLIRKEDLSEISNFLKSKKVSRLSKDQLENLKTPISSFFEFKIKEYSPSDLNNNNIIDLLDRGYMELISEIMPKSTNIAIIIDNYQTGISFNRYLRGLKNKGCHIINITKADEKYVACKVASLVARISRKMNVENINNKYRLKYQNENSQTIDVIPEAGSPSNLNTNRYLTIFRRQYPYANLPPFVRTRWSNVKLFEQSNPRKTTKIYYECTNCNSKINLIYVIDKKYTIELKCSVCKKQIDRTSFQKFIYHQNIVVDTSAIISKIVSKDLNTNKFFQNTTITIPSYVYIEIDNRTRGQKRGGQNEIDNISKFDKTLIELKEIDTHFLSSGKKNDMKILESIDNLNACLLTQDRNMAVFGKLSHPVFYVGEF